MEIETVSIAELAKDPKNARKHGQRNLVAIQESLKTFGQQKPIVVDAAGKVIAGNGTLEAARALGWSSISIIRTDLDDHKAKAFALADNKTAELAEWDDQALAAALAEIECFEDLDSICTGFNAGEIQRAIDAFGNDKMAEVETPEPPEIPTTKLGDLVILGQHRLLCGDSTASESFARLMGSEKAKLLCTDPPYGVDYTKTKNGIPMSGFENCQEIWGDIEADDLEGDKLQTFLEKVFKGARPFLDHAAWYLWHAYLSQGFFAAAAAAAAANLLIHRQIIWKKPGFVLTRSGQYHWAHELCFYGWIRGQSPAWHGNKSQTSVWEIDRDTNKGKHPTQKPIELFAIPIRNHLLEGEICLDPFCGSGSQILAAEQLGRRCFAIEIEPRWCDVAIARWEELTGKKAEVTNGP